MDLGCLLRRSIDKLQLGLFGKPRGHVMTETCHWYIVAAPRGRSFSKLAVRIAFRDADPEETDHRAAQSDILRPTNPIYCSAATWILKHHTLVL